VDPSRPLGEPVKKRLHSSFSRLVHNGNKYEERGSVRRWFVVRTVGTLSLRLRRVDVATVPAPALDTHVLPVKVRVQY
jgi:hypothetical protein